MSRVENHAVYLPSIPQVASGTVPEAERYVLGPKRPAAVTADRFFEDKHLVELFGANLVLLVTAPGTHTTITATVEASFDGVQWSSLLGAVKSDLSGLTIDVNGVSVAVALAQAGVVLPVVGGFPYYRIGLAGDNVAADGAGSVRMHLTRQT